VHRYQNKGGNTQQQQHYSTGIKTKCIVIEMNIVSNMNDNPASALASSSSRRRIKRPTLEDGTVDYDAELQMDIGCINVHFQCKKEVLERKIQALENEREKKIEVATYRNTISKLEDKVDLLRAAENYRRVEVIEEECWASKPSSLMNPT
jgi:hypothetical protein